MSISALADEHLRAHEKLSDATCRERSVWFAQEVVELRERVNQMAIDAQSINQPRDAEWPNERKAQRRLIDDDDLGQQMLRRTGSQRRVHDLGNSGYRVVTIEKEITVRDLAAVGAFRTPAPATLQTDSCPTRRSNAPGLDGDEVSLPSVGPMTLAEDEAQVAEIDIPSQIACDATNELKAKIPALKSICVDDMAAIYGIVQTTADRLLKSRQPATTRGSLARVICEFNSGTALYEPELPPTPGDYKLADAIMALWEK